MYGNLPLRVYYYPEYGIVLLHNMRNRHTSLKAFFYLSYSFPSDMCTASGKGDCIIIIIIITIICLRKFPS
jgi:hypothetical protein